MTGWKSKYGAIIGVIGGALLAALQVLPPGYEQVAIWLKFAGTLLSAGGGGLLGVGIAHKVEKSSTPK